MVDGKSVRRCECGRTSHIVVVEVVVHKPQAEYETTEQHPHSDEEVAQTVVQQKDAHPVHYRQLLLLLVQVFVAERGGICLVERAGFAVPHVGRRWVCNGHRLPARTMLVVVGVV